MSEPVKPMPRVRYRAYAQVERCTEEWTPDGWKNSAPPLEVYSYTLCSFAEEVDAQLYVARLSDDAAGGHADGCTCEDDRDDDAQRQDEQKGG